ncbi:phage tail protein [Pseudomonas guariconensis]|uniref:phage tail-collar fiber domain-containing protein n=1 Tax=Pseudomonas guariconensis TaxID=1288410 RepID=UPI00366F4127
MSQTYFALLTAVGEAKLANAAALGTQLQISRMAVGDGNGNLPVPSRTQTALINECYRADLNELKVDPNNASQIIAELVIPETEGGYWLREMGLYDATGALIAVSNCPPSYKPQMAEGSGRTQVLRMVLIVSSTAAVQLKIDPSVVLATRAYADSLINVHMAAADPHKQYRLRGAFTSLNASTALAAAHEGVIVLDATAGDRTLTLPASDAALGVRDYLIRRADNTGNRARVQASGADKIKFHTHLNADGYGFLYLMGAGDWWHLRSDGAGGWWPLGRLDSDALGRPVFETTTRVSPGGWGMLAGSTFNRADWPWLWDHAQQSAMLTTEAARLGMEGGWTSGDAATTFRVPEGRGEFLRLLDESRGVDPGRMAGSAQASQNLAHVHGFSSSVFVAAGGGASVLVTGSTLTTASSGGSEARPRSLAYPGRMKMI